MKILLDIDGVMIPARPWQSYQLNTDGFGMFSKFSVEGLNRIIHSALNPEIILTTSHKHKFTLKKWESIFSNRGISNIKIDRLSTNSIDVSRFQEITMWYMINQDEPFIILDDDKGLNKFDKDFKEEYLVLTKPTVDLNSMVADEAIFNLLLGIKTFLHFLKNTQLLNTCFRFQV